MNNHKILSFIGICMKAGKLVSGEFAVEKAVKSGQAGVVVVAADASENSKKQYTNMCTYYFLFLKRRIGAGAGERIQIVPGSPG